MGHDGIMTPEQAAQFYETDEDPKKIFAAFDAGDKAVTAAPADAGQPPARSFFTYRIASGVYVELRRKRLPEVSAAGPRSYASGRA
jgi:hypothetical protein